MVQILYSYVFLDTGNLFRLKWIVTLSVTISWTTMILSAFLIFLPIFLISRPSVVLGMVMKEIYFDFMNHP